jgi:hypothetical protein
MAGSKWGPKWGFGDKPAGPEQAWPTPYGTNSGATGSIQLTTSSGENVPGARDEQRVCQATFDKPTPCTVHIGVGSTIAGRGSWDFCAEAFDASSANVSTAKLIFEYGAGSVRRRVECDLRPGSYQLPPCNQVTVSIQVRQVTNPV